MKRGKRYHGRSEAERLAEVKRSLDVKKQRAAKEQLDPLPVIALGVKGMAK